ncbi:MAG: cyclohexanone monooxygenase [Gammaproteobacteria bacterium]|nr:cyclohexanone monooxygenase [Gammaproteobacteria bacterium]
MRVLRDYRGAPACGETAEKGENAVGDIRFDYDAVVIGAGFSGLGMLYRLREQMGLKVRVFERGDDVGGTWYWNRYPGARCDSESYIYCFSFSEELLQDWNWSGKYPEQPEILRYLQHVADRFDLRRDIQFETSVTAAHWDAGNRCWRVTTDDGVTATAQYLISGIGCISTGNIPDIPGLDSFEGQWHHTGAWPHEGVDFAGKRVAVIGTGSSGVQSIPVIAEQAEHLTVFQRTAQYTIPARHGTVDRKFLEEQVKPNYAAILEKAKWSAGGIDVDFTDRLAFEVSDQEREAIYEAGWQTGGHRFIFGSFRDITMDLKSNHTASEFIRDKIRATVQDPEMVEKLVPLDHPLGSKRALIDTHYFETYNRENVDLVCLKQDPIESITAKGVKTLADEREFDVIVFATGFDAMTGSFFRMDIRGEKGQALKSVWSEGPKTYLGLQINQFPNFFMITGPGSPSVLSNMPVSIEQHIEYIGDLIAHMRDRGAETVDVDAAAQANWVQHVNDVASKTLYMQANSWYLGANIPGKPRVFMPYAGGVGPYRQHCNEIAEAGYTGFVFDGDHDEARLASG